MDPAPRALSDTMFQSLPPRVRPPAGSRGSSSLPHRGASLTLPSNNRPLPPLFQGSREPTVPSVTHQAERARCRVIVAERTTSERERACNLSAESRVSGGCGAGRAVRAERRAERTRLLGKRGLRVHGLFPGEGERSVLCKIPGGSAPRPLVRNCCSVTFKKIHHRP